MVQQLKRIEWIDIAKFICIMFVIISHLESNTEILSVFFTPFFLSMFFFASGYVYKPKYKFKKFFFHKAKTLFLPWLIFSSFNIAASQIISFNAHSDFIEELKWYFLQIRGKGDLVWFVAALFVAYIPFYFVIRYWENNRNKKAAMLIFLSLMYAASVLYTAYMNPRFFVWNTACLPWHIEYIPQAVLFMFLGYLFRTEWEGTFDVIFVGKRKAAVLAVYIAAICLSAILSKCGFEFISLIYDNLIKLLGILFVTVISKSLKTNRYFSFVGRNTLTYFALHGKVYSLGQTVLNNLFSGVYTLVLSNSILSTLFAIAFAVVISVLLIVPAYIINRFFPFVLGKPYNKK